MLPPVKSRYQTAEAQAALELHGPDVTLAQRTYTARLLGADPALVLHGGGNTSAKATRTDRFGRPFDALYIKGSGWDLATILPPGHPAVRLAPLLELRALPSMSDEDMVAELRRNLVDPSAPTPSVETLLHAFLPMRFIDHTHADAVLALVDQPDGEAIGRSVYGDAMVWVPYVMPGFQLALRTAEAYEAAVGQGRTPSVIVLERHGVFTFGESARESYERMIDAVSSAERAIAQRRRSVSAVPARFDARAAAIVVPALRGALARAAAMPAERGPVVLLDHDDATLSFLARTDAATLVATGCATPDHVIRTGPEALLLRDLELRDAGALALRFDAAVSAHARAYDAYFAAMCAAKGVTKDKLASWPRAVLVEGVGLCAIGATIEEARVVSDIYRHTMTVMTDAADIGTYEPATRSDLFDMEYWSLEQAKLKKSAPSRLAGAIALVTGAGSGIGAATGAALVSLGAHVVLTDRDLGAVRELADRLGARASATVCDVTDAGSVQAAIDHACVTFGGLDVVVSNAGTAPEGLLGTQAGADALARSLEINLLSHNYVARAATAVFEAQRTGGCLLFNASKSAFNPGPKFGPYAVAKSALIALMRQYAVDYGGLGVRANAVNADRVRTGLFSGGVAESRARARGLSIDDYFSSNLLGREVLASDVAQAFAYFAEARATTGCVLTVDGGNAAAFPR